jgi:hypothetical protein
MFSGKCGRKLLGYKALSISFNNSQKKMENNTQEKKNEVVQNPGEASKTDAAIPGLNTDKKRSFSIKLFVKLIIVSVLIISAAQIYLYDSNKNGSDSGLGNIIKSIVPGENKQAGALSNTDIENIIKSLVPSGTAIALKDVTKEDGLYKLSISITGQNGPQDLTGFLTMDGKKFFPQVIDVTEAQKQVAAAGNTASAPAQPKEIAKTDKPKVELFVMSHCPYGTQIEKGMLPVADLLKNKIDFTIKFVNYAMHGEKEVTEELNQYCIQKEQTAKYENYLKCFLKAGNSSDCIKSAGINTNQLNTCVKATDKTFKITEKLNDKSTWSGGNYPPFDIYKTENEQYGVQGSPTLVINGAVASAGRDSKSLLSTICSAFTNQPSECSQQLSSTQPAPGFGDGAAANQNSSSCGN